MSLCDIGISSVAIINYFIANSNIQSIDYYQYQTHPQVLPRLYVGNYRDSKDPAQIKKYEITHILSIHDTPRRFYPDKHYLCVMASDSPDQNLSQYFTVCNDFIHAARLREGNVLIHCLAGKDNNYYYNPLLLL